MTYIFQCVDISCQTHKNCPVMFVSGIKTINSFKANSLDKFGRDFARISLNLIKCHLKSQQIPLTAVQHLAHV